MAVGPDDSGLPMIDVRTSEEFLLGLGPATQLRSLGFGNKQDACSLAQWSFGPQGSRFSLLSTWVSITLVKYGRYPQPS